MAANEQISREVLDACARLRRIPNRCLRDGHALVEWLADEARIIERAVRPLAPRQAGRR